VPVISNLKVQITAVTKGFRTKLRKLGKNLRAFGGAVKNVIGGVVKWGSVMAMVAAGALTVMIKRSIDAIDVLQKTARSVGWATQNFQALQYQADLAGVSGEQLNKSLQTMTKNVGDAAAGFGVAKTVMEAVGLDAEKLAAMRPEEAYLNIADAISKMGSQFDKMSAARAIFGRQGALMIAMLDEGKKGFTDMREELAKFGVTIDDAMGRKVEDAKDAFTRLSWVWKGFFQTLTVEVAPLLTAVVNKIAEMGFSGKTAGKFIVDAFMGVVQAFSHVLDAGLHLEASWVRLKRIAIGTAIFWAELGSIMIADTSKWAAEYSKLGDELEDINKQILTGANTKRWEEGLAKIRRAIESADKKARALAAKGPALDVATYTGAIKELGGSLRRTFSKSTFEGFMQGAAEFKREQERAAETGLFAKAERFISALPMVMRRMKAELIVGAQKFVEKIREGVKYSFAVRGSFSAAALANRTRQQTVTIAQEQLRELQRIRRGLEGGVPAG